MPYTFTDATLLDYKINNNYLGDGNLLLNRTKQIAIEGILYNRFKNLDGKGVKETYSGISDILKDVTGQYDSIVINNYNLGSGRVTNISFPENNPVLVGKYIYSIEIIENNNFDSLSGSTVYGSLYSIKDKIQSFDESLNFNYNSNGNYSYDHNIDLQYYNDDSDLILKSKNLVSGLFNDSLSLGLFGNFSGYYTNLKTNKNYFNENYDLINKKCSFEKRIEINKNYQSNYTITNSHNLSFSNDGKATITEEGTIISLENTNLFTVTGFLQNEINNSYNRCSSLYGSYINKYNLGSYDSLNPTGFTFSRNLNLFNNSLNYSVSYTNTPSFLGNLIHDYSTTYNINNDQIVEYSEQGSIYKVGQLGAVTNFAQQKSKYLEAKLRVLNANANLKIKSSSMNLEKINDLYGNSLSYNISATTDKSLLLDNTYKELSIEIQDSDGKEINNEYIIANKETKNMLFNNGDQINLSSKNITLNGYFVRPNYDIWQSGIRTLPLFDLKNKAIFYATNLISDDAFIDSISYRYGSDNAFSFNLNIKYLKKI